MKVYVPGAVPGSVLGFVPPLEPPPPQPTKPKLKASAATISNTRGRRAAMGTNRTTKPAKTNPLDVSKNTARCAVKEWGAVVVTLKVTVAFEPFKFTSALGLVDEPLPKLHPDSFALGSVVQERFTVPVNPARPW
jgi:hypothetical protein